MELLELADIVRANAVLHRYKNTDKPWFASFENCEIKEDGVLITVSGNGHSPCAALANYAEKIRGKTIVLNASKGARREFDVPDSLAADEEENFLCMTAQDESPLSEENESLRNQLESLQAKLKWARAERDYLLGFIDTEVRGSADGVVQVYEDELRKEIEPFFIENSQEYTIRGMVRRAAATKQAIEGNGNGAILITKSELDELPEHSKSLPQVAVIGKKWKRRRDINDESKGWMLGEYVESSDDQDGVDIFWMDLTIVDFTTT